METFEVAIRADASRIIGSGHVSRCVEIAKKLRSRGVQVFFICQNLDGNLINVVTKSGFHVEIMNFEHERDSLSPVEQVWGSSYQIGDSVETLELIKRFGCKTVVVDHYGLDAVWEKRVGEYSARLVVIDDAHLRVHSADVCINPNFADASENSSDDRVPTEPTENNFTEVFNGIRYSLVGMEYVKLPNNRSSALGQDKSVLVFMGGADKANLTAQVIDALLSTGLSHINIKALVGPSNMNFTKLTEAFSTKASVQILGAVPDMAELLYETDIAIGAGGVAALERVAAGVPSIIIAAAANQESNCRILSELQVAEFLGSVDNISWGQFGLFFVSFLNDFEAKKRMSLEMRYLVDGLGPDRVSELIVPSKLESMSIRKALPGDVDIYFDWVNDPKVRANSLVGTEIKREDHHSWFTKQLNSPNSRLYLFELANLPVAQVRFEIKSDRWHINYSLDSVVRGRGWSKRIIDLACRRFFEEFSDQTIHAEVLLGNAASERSLQAAGFVEDAPQSFGQSKTLKLRNSNFMYN